MLSEGLTNIRAEFNVIIAMASHPRLGARSPLRALDSPVLEMVARFLLENEFDFF